MRNNNLKKNENLLQNSDIKPRKNCISLFNAQNSNSKKKLLSFDLYKNKYKIQSRNSGNNQLSPYKRKTKRNRSCFSFSINLNELNLNSKKKDSITLSEFYLKTTQYKKSSIKPFNYTPKNKTFFNLTNSKSISKVMSCIYKNENANKLKDINNLLDSLTKNKIKEKITVNKKNYNNKINNKHFPKKKDNIFEIIPVTINENEKLADDKKKFKVHLAQIKTEYYDNIDIIKYNDKTNTKNILDNKNNINIEEYETPNFIINNNK